MDGWMVRILEGAHFKPGFQPPVQPIAVGRGDRGFARGKYAVGMHVYIYIFQRGTDRDRYKQPSVRVGAALPGGKWEMWRLGTGDGPGRGWQPPPPRTVRGTGLGAPPSCSASPTPPGQSRSPGAAGTAPCSPLGG